LRVAADYLCSPASETIGAFTSVVKRSAELAVIRPLCKRRADSILNFTATQLATRGWQHTGKFESQKENQDKPDGQSTHGLEGNIQEG
jgi:hypothetical protein